MYQPMVSISGPEYITMSLTSGANKWASRAVIILQLAAWSTVGIILLHKGVTSLRNTSLEARNLSRLTHDAQEIEPSIASNDLGTFHGSSMDESDLSVTPLREEFIANRKQESSHGMPLPEGNEIFGMENVFEEKKDPSFRRTENSIDTTEATTLPILTIGQTNDWESDIEGNNVLWTNMRKLGSTENPRKDPSEGKESNVGFIPPLPKVIRVTQPSQRSLKDRNVEISQNLNDDRPRDNIHKRRDYNSLSEITHKPQPNLNNLPKNESLRYNDNQDSQSETADRPRLDRTSNVENNDFTRNLEILKGSSILKTTLGGDGEEGNSETAWESRKRLRLSRLSGGGAAAAVAMVAVGAVMLVLGPAVVILRALDERRQERRFLKLSRQDDLPPTYEQATLMDEAPRYSTLSLSAMNGCSSSQSSSQSSSSSEDTSSSNMAPLNNTGSTCAAVVV